MPDPLTITVDQIRSFRLRRQRLARRAPRGRLVEVARELLGIQTQVGSMAALSLWNRVEGITPETIEEEVARSRRLTRTWCMRGTVHLIGSADQPLFAAALGSDVGGLKRALQRRGLSEQEHGRLRDQVVGVLAGGPRTRSEIETEISRQGTARTDLFGSWGGILRVISQEGLIIFGPRRSGETTFILAGQRRSLAALRRRPIEAGAPMLSRYLRAFGPARLADFAYWSGLSVLRSREALSILGDSVVMVALPGSAPKKGQELVLVSDDWTSFRRSRPTPVARLLPSFDCLLLGHRDKSLLIGPAHYKKVFRKAAWISPTILVDGRVAGTWTHRRFGTRLHVTLHPFTPLGRTARTALHNAAHSMG